MFDVNMLSRFVSAHRQTHWNIALRVLQYLKETDGQYIFLPTNDDLTLNAYWIQIGLVVL